MKVLNWNLARHAPGTPEGRELLHRISAEHADVICVTEAHTGSLAELGGHVLTDRGVRWDEETENECKVALWSPEPWTDRAPTHELSEVGGAIIAATDTPLGRVQVVGVCMPYNMAWPKDGSHPQRPQPWSQHLLFLDRLKPLLAQLDSDCATIVVGDFNQYNPLNWGSWDAHHALNDTLDGLHIVTTGAIEPISEQTVDHVAVSPHLRAASIRGLDRYAEDGSALSDHFGLAVELEAGGVRLIN